MTSNEMRQAIIDSPKQLSADLTIVDKEKLSSGDKFIVCGMGGSALAAGLFKVYRPRLDLLVHRDYGLPRVPEYFLMALERGLKLAVLTSGGRLLERAEQLGLPRLVMPTGLPPRLAVGLMFVGLARFCLTEAVLEELAQVAQQLGTEDLEAEGKRLAESVDNRLPLIYSSTINFPLAYNWKISFNETAKLPAFANCLPELNHNEMTSPTDNFHYFFLRDSNDEEKINKRFSLLGQLFKAKGALVEMINLPTRSSLEKIFWTICLANWLTYHLALRRGVDPVEVPIIEKFKQDLCAIS